jgi:hypothetical protein
MVGAPFVVRVKEGDIPATLWYVVQTSVPCCSRSAIGAFDNLDGKVIWKNDIDDFALCRYG